MDNIFSNLKLNINTEKTKKMVCSKQNEPNINICIRRVKDTISIFEEI